MSELELIISALTAGAGAGASNAATAAVMDTYAALKTLLRSWLAGRPEAENALAAEITEVDTLRNALADDLVQSGATRDDAVLDLALQLLGSTESGVAPKYQVDLRDAKAVQVGDNKSQTVTFN